MDIVQRYCLSILCRCLWSCWCSAALRSSCEVARGVAVVCTRASIPGQHREESSGEVSVRSAANCCSSLRPGDLSQPGAGNCRSTLLSRERFIAWVIVRVLLQRTCCSTLFSGGITRRVIIVSALGMHRDDHRLNAASSSTEHCIVFSLNTASCSVSTLHRVRRLDLSRIRLTAHVLYHCMAASL